MIRLMERQGLAVPESSRSGRAARPARARRLLASVLVGALLVGAGLIPGPEAEGSLPSEVEDLLWDLQLAPLDGPPTPFTLTGLDGKTYSPAAARGQVVLLYFWATW